MFNLWYNYKVVGEKMSIDLSYLNEQQKEAVIMTEGPVMAMAGAGSGKTSVLTKRIAFLVYEKRVNPHNILAITFTNKAANEMKDRIYKELNIPTRMMWVSTFHSMCARILRDYIEVLGYSRSFQIIDDDDQLQQIKSIIKRLNYDTKMFPPKTVKAYIQKLKQDYSFESEIEEPLREVVLKVYDIYQSELKRNNLVDYDGLITLTIELLKNHKEVRDYYHTLFKYVLVDEFQDTNNIQYQLIKLLVNSDHNLFIVGDEDQSIYAFRGANIENIRKFQRDFPDFHLVLLEDNYRSTQTILNAANELISNNTSRIKKELRSTKGVGEEIVRYKAMTARDEVEYVLNEALRLRMHGYSFNDMVIMYRAHALSRLFEDVLLMKGIPYRIHGNLSFFKRKEIKDMTAFLRLIINHNDDYSFERAITNPKRGLGAVTIGKLSVFARERNLSLFEAIDYCSELFSKGPCSKFIAFRDMVKHFRELLESTDLPDMIDVILQETGYLEMLRKDEKGDIRLENILEIKTLLTGASNDYSELPKEEQLMFLLEDMALKAEESNEDIEDGITLMTLHNAKGLEYKVVFIVALEMGIFPSFMSMHSIKDIEEERRLMYVGVTRAEERLYLTNASVRMLYGQTNASSDSIFLDELPKQSIESKGMLEKKDTGFKKTVTKKVNNYKENDIRTGDKVQHKSFGKGVVVSVDGDFCKVAFGAEFGVKQLLKNHKALKKL